MSVIKEQWASRMGLVLAMAGNAVGLGNFLRFPAQAVKNGGGAFLIPYLVSFLILGLPLMWIEWGMGRYGGQFGHHSGPGIMQAMDRRRFWKYFGVFGLWSNLIIAAYYLYIESWTMAYAGYALIGGFNPNSTIPGLKMSGKEFMDYVTGEQPNQIFAVSSFGLVLFTICILINVWILTRGLAKGIELVSKVGMPLLIIFGALLAIRGLLITPPVEGEAAQFFTDPHAVESPLVGLNFVWEPKFDSLWNPAVWLAAAGQVFFTLSIGMGSINCYSSYLKRHHDVTLTGATSAWTNEFCEVILGGSILIPIAVAYLGLDSVKEMTGSGSGFGLGFVTFPTLFQNWGWLAPAAGFMWFGLLFFAAITSSLAMGQPIMAFLQTEFQVERKKSALLFGAMLLPLALPCALLSQRTFFDDFDYWAGTFCLVVYALAEAVLFAWVFGMDRGWKELMTGAELKIPAAFYYVMKYVTPVFLIVIFVGNVFQPSAGWDGYAKALVAGEKLPEWEWAADGMIGKLLNKDLVIKDEDSPAKKEFIGRVGVWRLVDRLVLIGVFALCGGLVFVAWKRRRREGLHTGEEAEP